MAIVSVVVMLIYVVLDVFRNILQECALGGFRITPASMSLAAMACSGIIIAAQCQLEAGMRERLVTFYSSLAGLRIVFSPGTLLYAISNICTCMAYSHGLPAICVVVLGKTYLGVAACISSLLLGKSYAPMEWVSIISVNLCVPIFTYKFLLYTSTFNNHDRDHDTAHLAVAYVYVGSVCSALSSVIFEKILHRTTGINFAMWRFGVALGAVPAIGLMSLVIGVVSPRARDAPWVIRPLNPACSEEMCWGEGANFTCPGSGCDCGCSYGLWAGWGHWAVVAAPVSFAVGGSLWCSKGVAGASRSHRAVADVATMLALYAVAEPLANHGKSAVTPFLTAIVCFLGLSSSLFAQDTQISAAVAEEEEATKQPSDAAETSRPSYFIPETIGRFAAPLSLLMFFYPLPWALLGHVPSGPQMPLCPAVESSPYGIHNSGFSRGHCRDTVCGFVYMPAARQVALPVGAENVSRIEDLPSSACRRIYETDLADGGSARECLSFCDEELGRGIHWPVTPWCAAVGDSAAALHTACGKAWTAWCFGWLRVPGLQYLVGAAYFYLTWRQLQGHLRAILWSDAMNVFASPRLDLAEGLLGGESSADVRGPDRSSCRAEGPYKGKHAMPLKLLGYPCPSDAHGEHWNLRIAALTVFSDPPLDIACAASYLADGQPWFFTIQIMSFTLTGDPLQVEGMAALGESLERGYATRGLWHHRAKEGILEGRIGTLIAFFAIAIQDPMRIAPATVLLRLFSLATSCLAVAASAEARLLLAQQDGTLDDYYAVCVLRKQYNWSKMAAVSSVMSFAMVAVLGRLTDLSSCTALAFFLLFYMAIQDYRGGQHSAMIQYMCLGFLYIILIFVIVPTAFMGGLPGAESMLAGLSQCNQGAFGICASALAQAGLYVAGMVAMFCCPILIYLRDGPFGETDEALGTVSD